MAPKKRTTRASPATTTTTTSVTNAQLNALIDKGVADALAARDDDRSINGDDNHNSGTGVRRIERVARECIYPDFMKCQPLNFKGTEGVVELTQWFEKMETVFHISNCSVENQIKFSTCTLLGSALTWWNPHVRTPDMIHRSVVASNPKTMQEAIEMATELIDKKIHTFAERVAIAYTTGPGERKEYVGTLPLSPAATNNQRNSTCCECGNQGHYRSDCPKLKNQNHGNQAEGTGARGVVHALGGGETDQDLNNIEDDINA
ncbi:hypothetical protein Tco_1320139 [Tanacetum coccineum]